MIVYYCNIIIIIILCRQDLATQSHRPVIVAEMGCVLMYATSDETSISDD